MDRLPTFAETVAAYLDRYKAEETGGQFISVDPDGDGKKQAIFVTAKGKVNPRSKTPGKWPGFVPGKPGRGKRQEKDSPGQLGTHDDPFTGKFKRKPEKQQRLPNQDTPKKKPKPQYKYKSGKPLPAHEKTVGPTLNKDGTPRANSRAKKVPVGGVTPMKLDSKTGKRLHTDKRGRLISRETFNFDQSAREYGFPEGHEPTAEEMQTLKENAKEVQRIHNEHVDEIRDAMQEMFGNVNLWQRRARAAKDIKGLEKHGIDTIISAQNYSDDESNLLGIIASHAGVDDFTRSGGDFDENIVFDALRKPLPKRLPLAHPDIIESAAELMQTEGGPDDDAPVDDLDIGDFGEFAAEHDEIPFTDQFSMTFRDAAARYAGQLGLWDDPVTGKYKTKGQKQGKLFDAKGESWKDQPRVAKGNKEGGQWTKGNSPTSPAMDQARAEFRAKSAASQYTRKTDRLTIAKTIEKMGGESKLRNSKPHELSQKEYILAQVLRISDKRSRLLVGNKPLAKFLQQYIAAGDVDWREFAREIKEIEGGEKAFDEMNKAINGGPSYNSRGPVAAEWAFNWLQKDIVLDLEKQMGSLPMRPVFLQAVIGKHRDAVRKAIKKGIDVPGAAYEDYHDADWQPGNEDKSTRASMQYCRKTDSIKETDAFRVRASVGRKLKTAANKYINKERKSLLAGREKLGKEIDEKQAAMDEHMRKEEGSMVSSNPKAWEKWRDEYQVKKEELSEMRDRQFTYFKDWIKELPSNTLRKKGDKPGLTPNHRAKFSDAQKDSVAKACQWIEEMSGNAMPAITFETNKTRRNRSFQSGGGIHMNRNQLTQSVLLHELGHIIDAHTDQGNKTKAFEAQAIQKHKTKWTGGGCKPYEVGSKNGFMRAYTGKYYEHAKSSEVLSMGIQHLHDDPLKFAKESPDHFNFTIASLRGLL